jgi:hypothetical protein
MGIMVEELDAFGRAMEIAERHRTILRKRFGLTDQQIGMMTIARRKRSAMSEYATAVLAARRRMRNK